MTGAICVIADAPHHLARRPDVGSFSMIVSRSSGHGRRVFVAGRNTPLPGRASRESSSSPAHAGIDSGMHQREAVIGLTVELIVPGSGLPELATSASEPYRGTVSSLLPSGPCHWTTSPPKARV